MINAFEEPKIEVVRFNANDILFVKSSSRNDAEDGSCAGTDEEAPSFIKQ